MARGMSTSTVSRDASPAELDPSVILSSPVSMFPVCPERPRAMHSSRSASTSQPSFPARTQSATNAPSSATRVKAAKCFENAAPCATTPRATDSIALTRTAASRLSREPGGAARPTSGRVFWGATKTTRKTPRREYRGERTSFQVSRLGRAENWRTVGRV